MMFFLASTLGSVQVARKEPQRRIFDDAELYLLSAAPSRKSIHKGAGMTMKMVDWGFDTRKAKDPCGWDDVRPSWCSRAHPPSHHCSCGTSAIAPHLTCPKLTSYLRLMSPSALGRS